MFISGIGLRLPPATKVEQVVAEGRLDPMDAEDMALESVCEATDEAPPDMAVSAARIALERSGRPPGEIALIAHASVYFQGLELYPTASYIHRYAVGEHSALAFEVKNASNGCMTALDLAARWLAGTGAGSDGAASALVTAADRIAPPAIDRWTNDIGIVPGDGAVAAVLTTEEGFARMLSSVTVSDPTLEGLHRGDAPFTPHSDPTTPLDLRSRKLQYLADVELDEFTRRFRLGLHRCVATALADAGVGLGDIARFVVPHFGRTVLRRECLLALDIDEERTTWSWGRTVGHLGAGDQIAGLGHLIEAREVGVGDHVMLLGVGAGFTWTCGVVRILDVPTWRSA